MPLIIQVVGPSGAGKTLVLEQSIRRLRREGFRVAALKHSHHPIDLPGKDTDRLRRSGADPVLFASEGWALFSLGEVVVNLPDLPVDVVLVEGYHRRRLSPHRFTVRDPLEAPGIVDRITELAHGTSRSHRGATASQPTGPPPPLGPWLGKATKTALRGRTRRRQKER